MESVTISKFQKRQGPDIFRENDVEKFIQSNSLSEVMWLGSDNRINCILSRDFTDVRDYLKFIFQNKHNLIGIPNGLKSDFLSGTQFTPTSIPFRFTFEYFFNAGGMRTNASNERRQAGFQKQQLHRSDYYLFPISESKNPPHFGKSDSY